MLEGTREFAVVITYLQLAMFCKDLIDRVDDNEEEGDNEAEGDIPLSKLTKGLE